MPRNKKSLQEQIFLDIGDDLFTGTALNFDDQTSTLLSDTYSQSLQQGFDSNLKIEIINSDDTNSKKEIEIKPEINKKGELNLTSLVENIRALGFLPFESLVFYFEKTSSMFVHIDDSPSKNSYLRISQDTQKITLKFRNNKDLKENISENQSQSKRSQQRKIIEVMKLVYNWKKEILNQDAMLKDSAKVASEIGVPKKTLDDYQLQLRLGKDFCFDFQKNINLDMSVLRTYVRNCKDALPRNTPRNYKKCSTEFVLFLKEQIREFENLSNIGSSSFETQSLESEFKTENASEVRSVEENGQYPINFYFQKEEQDLLYHDFNEMHFPFEFQIYCNQDNNEWTEKVNLYDYLPV